MIDVDDRPLAGRTFTWEPTAKIEFGVGAIERLPATVTALGARHAVVVTDPGLRAAGVLDRVLDVLRAAGVGTTVADGIRANPTTGDLDTAAALARADRAGAPSGVVVGLGGGSALDSAKVVSLLLTNSGTALELDTAAEVRPGMPVVAVPTTAGTGAETNGFAVVEDGAAARKVYLGGPSVVPVACVLDPELTLGLPPAPTAATGVDALVHGIESLASRGSTPASAAYAVAAVEMVARWLPVAVADGSDLEARCRLLLAAHLAGRALTLSGLGLVHGIGHSMSNHLGTVHGVALAAVLPEVMRFCADAAAPAYQAAGRAMDARDPVDAAEALTTAVGARRPLRDLGLTADLVGPVARGAVQDAVSRNSPRQASGDDVAALLTSALLTSAP